jgi:hypothetical protein
MIYIIVGVGLILVAIAYKLGHKKGTANATVSASSLLDQAKAHAEAIAKSVEASAKAHADAGYKVLKAEVAKVKTDVAIVAKPVANPVANPEPAPAQPAAPAAVAVETPPVAVAAGVSGPVAVETHGEQMTLTVQAPYTKNPASNTPDWRIWTDTSPEGYAVRYALGGDGKPVTDAAGHAISMLVYDGHTFPNAAAIAAFKEGVAANATGAAARDAAAAATVYTGPVPAAGLTPEDLKYLNWKMHQPGEINWAYKALAGTADAVHGAINAAEDLSAQMHGFDPAGYTGPLKAVA